MDRIQLNATWANIPAGNLGQFKSLAAQAMEIAKGEPGVVRYDWFFNDDETACIALETYENSDVLLAHIGHLGELRGNIFEVGGGCDLAVFGNPSKELLEAGAGLNVSVFRFFQGK